jgi:hypothetical protein
MKENSLSSLRKELEDSFGRKVVSSRDCLQMVEDIYHKTGETINANTLRRFFGLVKADYPASNSTLNILSKYCGFNSIDEVEKIAATDITDNHINSEEVLKYLVSLFRDSPVAGNHDKVFNSLVRQTIIFLDRNLLLADKFQREIAKTTAGQYYYFEQSVNMDRLNSYYGDGLRHYLREKNTDEAKIFAHSLQIFRHWLTNNIESMDKHITKILSISVSQNFPSHILGRFIAARFYYANAKGETIEKILAEAKKYHTIINITRGIAFPAIPDFELIVCEALILTGHYEEAKEYIWKNKGFYAGEANSNITDSPFRLWENILKNSNLYKYKDKLHKPKSQFNHSVDSHLAKRYNAIVNQSLNRIHKGKQQTSNQLAELIKETGFVRFLYVR